MIPTWIIGWIFRAADVVEEGEVILDVDAVGDDKVEDAVSVVVDKVEDAVSVVVDKVEVTVSVVFEGIGLVELDSVVISEVGVVIIVVVVTSE